MGVSEAHPKSAWAVSLQERLLFWAAVRASKDPLPTSFPSDANNPTPLWGKLRLAALIGAKHWESARKAIRALKPDPEGARLSAQYFLARKRPDLAVEVPELPSATKEYLLRVSVSDSALVRLERSRSKSLRKKARFERAVRLAARGKWRQGAKLLKKSDPARMKLWTKAAVLAEGGDAKRLAYARFLRDHHGQLLYPADRGFYRGVSFRHQRLAPSAKEAEAVERALERSSERWLALETYTRWLGKHTSEPGARGVLSEADGVYNLLVNWAGGDYYFWGRYAKKTAEVAELRKLGKAIRSAHP